LTVSHDVELFDELSLLHSSRKGGQGMRSLARGWMRGVRGPCSGTMVPSLEVNMLANTTLLIGTSCG
jgi:hypothetical protein